MASIFNNKLDPFFANKVSAFQPFHSLKRQKNTSEVLWFTSLLYTYSTVKLGSGKCLTNLLKLKSKQGYKSV